MQAIKSGLTVLLLLTTILESTAYGHPGFGCDGPCLSIGGHLGVTSNTATTEAEFTPTITLGYGLKLGPQASHDEHEEEEEEEHKDEAPDPRASALLALELNWSALPIGDGNGWIPMPMPGFVLEYRKSLFFTRLNWETELHDGNVVYSGTLLAGIETKWRFLNLAFGGGAGFWPTPHAEEEHENDALAETEEESQPYGVGGTLVVGAGIDDFSLDVLYSIGTTVGAEDTPPEVTTEDISTEGMTAVRIRIRNLRQSRFTSNLMFILAYTF